jgi:hypothetical protein
VAKLASELFDIAADLSARCVTEYAPGPYSDRGKAAQRKKREENPYYGGNGQAAGLMGGE